MADSRAWIQNVLAHYEADRARSRLAMLHGEILAVDAAAQQRLRFLRSDESLEARQDALGRGELGGPAGEALRQHLAWARADVQFIEGQAAWERALAETTSTGKVASAELSEVLATRDAAARAQQLRGCLERLQAPAARCLHQQVGFCERLVAEGGVLANVDLSSRARMLLDETEAPVAEWIAYLARPHMSRGPLRLDAALCALRGTHLDGIFRTSGRFRRVAAPLRALGFERIMGQRMRTEVDGVRLLPAPAAERLSAQDIRVAGHGRLGGVLAELAALHGAASGLSLSLASPELSWELSAPLLDHPCHALGGLFAQLLVDPVFLRRVYGLSGKDLEQVRRQAALGLLVSMRLGAVVIQLSGASGAHLVERSVQGLREALQVDCDAWALPLLCDDYAALYSRFCGQLSALRLHVAMRERFDEDYFINPRFADVVMAASMRGNELTMATFLDEVGADPAWEKERLREIV